MIEHKSLIPFLKARGQRFFNSAFLAWLFLGLLSSCADQPRVVRDIWFESLSDTASAYYSYEPGDAEFAATRKQSLEKARSLLRDWLSEHPVEASAGFEDAAGWLRREGFFCESYREMQGGRFDRFMVCKQIYSGGPISISWKSSDEPMFQPVEWSILFLSEQGQVRTIVSVSDLGMNEFGKDFNSGE
ncbi:hypothetical protein [Aestuariispira insulae]|uniref:Uncharacterized protein n=1 Tax=Aestuariispira insulae TaxID=1461337 RepID=A0A3D9H5I2_9PROT|nr:hypothetical protein [Aestuariispira insulae]RED44692.1 hypothetical protein DFP90_11454 [Aestuariispira insulae]